MVKRGGGVYIGGFGVQFRGSSRDVATPENPFPKKTKSEKAMTVVKTGDTVRIHYTGTLNDGSVFDSSEGRDPLEFTVGARHVIEGLDSALEGMAVGEARTVVIPAELAYGAHDPAGRQEIPRGHVPDHIPLEIGGMLEMSLPDGRAMPVVVAEVTDEVVVLDANHPLAGQELTFVVEMIEIV